MTSENVNASSTVRDHGFKANGIYKEIVHDNDTLLNDCIKFSERQMTFSETSIKYDSESRILLWVI